MAFQGSRIEHFPIAVSARIVAAIDLFAPRDGERLLEIGCGTGQATALICARTSARVVAIDRSDTAVARARIVNAGAIAAGQAEVRSGDIDTAPIPPRDFDRTFALRVNSFWTKPGVALPNLAASLRSGGEAWILYDADLAKSTEPVLRSLEARGFTDVRTFAAPGAFAIVGRKR
ncbi:methyltransferase domain-containing protein [Sphingosinicella sp. LHD-64]|uniref:class I SAM-dependent methyltransferase n=1 Tax=Sphingosinicella sp. LHD-64 TaxID=3072139 RepID=UPI0028109ACF|nr:methyltransferase domain-containing protein [Sphingosinicella sp. LHD-64]MDQ8755898.1 methyltransferase domain-containing protein [Sphingosinicella sp. LHD-64]